MLLRLCYFIITCTLWLVACAQSPSPTPIIPITDTFTFTLGETPVTLTLRTYQAPSSLFYIHLHDNESTAEKAAIKLLEQKGGQLLSIENKEQRLINFYIKNDQFRVDPNRIFTDMGIDSTLSNLSKNDSNARTVVSAFAQYILSLIPDSVLVVAMHNNTDNRFSVLSYQAAPLNTEVSAIHINPKHDVDDFILTTDSLLFQHYKAKNVNALLQHNQPLIDDGSLSIYFGKQNKRYINIETEHGHASQQHLLLEQLYEFINREKKLSSEFK